MESILTSIKKLLGITEDYDHFDTDIIIHINTAFLSLTQLGIGPSTGFSIYGDVERWEDFIGESKELEAVKTYVYLKVKMIFDPPVNSFVLDSMKRTTDELEWRLNIQSESKKEGNV